QSRAEPVGEDGLAQARSLGVGAIGLDVGAVGGLPANLAEPVQGGVLNGVFVEDAHRPLLGSPSALVLAAFYRLLSVLSKITQPLARIPFTACRAEPVERTRPSRAAP